MRRCVFSATIEWTLPSTTLIITHTHTSLYPRRHTRALPAHIVGFECRSCISEICSLCGVLKEWVSNQPSRRAKGERRRFTYPGNNARTLEPQRREKLFSKYRMDCILLSRADAIHTHTHRVWECACTWLIIVCVQICWHNGKHGGIHGPWESRAEWIVKRQKRGRKSPSGNKIQPRTWHTTHIFFWRSSLFCFLACLLELNVKRVRQRNAEMEILKEER